MTPRSRKPVAGAAEEGGPVVSDPQAAVAHQEGWEVGNTAPEDRHAPLKMDGTADLDKISKTPPKGGFGGRLIAAKGDLVTPEIRQQLGLDK